MSAKVPKQRARESLNIPCKTCAEMVFTRVVCGACRRVLDSERVALNLSELRELFKLTRKHWGSGKPRELIYAPGGYRPCFIVKPTDRDRAGRTPDEQKALIAECVERARLADLYDRAQATRGDKRRAVRA
jgi:hypothetical protein